MRLTFMILACCLFLAKPQKILRIPNGKIQLCGMTQTLRQSALDSHNNVRQGVASGNKQDEPPASNMNVLTYSSELEAYANEWVTRIIFCHYPDRYDKNGWHVKQNVHSSYSKILPTQQDPQIIANSVKSWYAEHWNMENHQTLLWSVINEVGCGVVTVKRDTNYETIVMCIYRGGNRLGYGETYAQGTGCLSCQSSCNSKFNALCGQPLDYGITSNPGTCGPYKPKY